MDTDQIKIEPPTVVKEELEIVRYEKYEVKLENEEKPQAMEESTSARTTEKYEMGIDEENMVQTPETEEIIKTGVSENECHSPELKKRNLDERDTTENDAYMNLSTKVRREVKRQCCYCGEKRTEIDLTRVPQYLTPLKKWANKLGEGFYKKAVGKTNVFICRSHFDVKWEDRRPYGLLPSASYGQLVSNEFEEKVEKVVNFDVSSEISIPIQGKLEKPNIDDCSEEMDEEKPPWSLEKEVFHTVVCRYCGDRCIKTNMTKVPRNEKQLLDWATILGEKFLANVRNHKDNRICWSHFNQRDSKRRKSDNLPLTDQMKLINNEPPTVVKEELELVRFENYEVKLENEEKPQVIEESTSVENIEKHEMRIDELPIVVKEELVNEVKLKNEEKPSTLEEFRSEEIKSSASENVKKDVMGIDEVCLSRCCCCGETRKSEEMVRVPKTHNEVFKWSKILGKQFLKNYTIMSMVCRSHFDKKFAAINFVSGLHRKSIMIENRTEAIRCCYCQKFGLADSMTTVSKYDSIFVEWVKILGEEFREHFKTNNDGVICKIHFACRWKGSRPSYLLPMANSKAGYTPQPRCFCIFCGKLKLQYELMIVTSNPMWVEILGEDIYRKAIGRGQKFICRSHIDDLWNHAGPSTVKWGDRRPNGLLPSASFVEMVSNVMGEERAQSESLDETSRFMEVKLEEPDIHEDSDEKPPHLLDVEIQHPMNFKIQEGFSDQKRIKLDFKEENEEE